MADGVIGEGRHLRLVSRGGWELVERRSVTGIVAIVAITDADELVLTEQHRVPVGRRVIDLPAGLAGDIPGEEDEALATAAARELSEETGFDATHLERLAEGPPSPGLSTEIVTFFHAKGVRRTGPGGGEGTESIDVHVVPMRGLRAWLRAEEAAGKLVDLKVWAGLYLALDREGS
ncbi:NUDIX hydrolase [Myxococcota bacterium]|nr:NUDIX hydrolase [Myxococcota bacterium]